jgi:cytochrome b6-f complex iron-sulfur subunit
MNSDDSNKDEVQRVSVSRRSLLKIVAASSGTVVFGSWLSACSNSETAQAPAQGSGSSSGVFMVDLTRPENQALTKVGGTVVLNSNPIDPIGILLYRESETSVLAFSRKCTHQGCPVAAFQNGVANCPCHGSQYGTKGQVLRGPATAALKRYAASLSGTGVIISNAG